MTEKKDVNMEKLTDIDVDRFATALAEEIAALNKKISNIHCLFRYTMAKNHVLYLENPKSKKLIFQKLPCHMRRRAMSHNPKRMPRALREAHKAQVLRI
jgi:regulator of replication initiation timing